MSNKRLVAISEEQVRALRALYGAQWSTWLDDLADSYEDGITVEEGIMLTTALRETWRIQSGDEEPDAATSLWHKLRRFTALRLSERSPDPDA